MFQKRLIFLLLLFIVPFGIGYSPYTNTTQQQTDINRGNYVSGQGQTPYSYTTAPQITPLYSLNWVFPTNNNLTLKSDGNITFLLDKKNSTITLGFARDLNTVGVSGNFWDSNKNQTGLNGNKTGIFDLVTTGVIQAGYFTSTIGSGTAPFFVTSTDKVLNLNADMLDGLHASDLNGFIDTNWQTSYPVFDANMSLQYVKQSDGNIWYAKSSDINSNFVPYNGALTDVNLLDKNISTTGIGSFKKVVIRPSNFGSSNETVSLTTNMANMTGSESGTNYTGIKFTVKTNEIRLQKITKHAGCTADTAYLLASDKSTILASASFVGNDANFNYLLSADVNYYAASKNANDSSFEEKYSLQGSWGGESYPIAGTNLTLIATLYSNADSLTSALSIVSVTTTGSQIIMEHGDLNISGDLVVNGTAPFVPFENSPRDFNLNSKNMKANVGIFAGITVTSGGGSSGATNETVSLTTNMANMTGSETSTNYRGLKFYVNVANTNFTKITKHANCTADTAYLMDSGHSVLASASFVGNDATFSYVLTAGNSYYASAKNADNSSYEGKYSLQASWGGESYPIAGTNLTLIATNYDNTDNTSNAVAIVSVTSTGGTTTHSIILGNGDVNISHNLYLPDGNSYAKHHIDFTPYFTGTTKAALDSLIAIKGTSGDLNHQTLPDFARVELKHWEKVQNGETCKIIIDTKKCSETDYNKGLCNNTISFCQPKFEIKQITTYARDIGSMVTLQTEAIKELKKQNDDLNLQLSLLKIEFCKIALSSILCK